MKKTLTKRLTLKKETLLELDLGMVVGGVTNTCADCNSTSCNVQCRTH